MKLDEIKQGLSSFWDSVSEGWQHLRESAASALTRFKPSEKTNLPAKGEVDDLFYMPTRSWSMLGGNLFEDEKRVVVQLEVPGLDKQDLDIEIQGSTLVVRGEKRFEREATEGRYRVLQCAYGAFQRIVPLSVDVVPDEARATYKNGVLRIELPKVNSGVPGKHVVKID